MKLTLRASGNIRIDVAQLEQILLALLTNARDAMPDGGLFTISTGIASLKNGSYVRLSVCDTGGGISEEALDRLFEPFFTTKPKHLGGGLALAVVYAIVKQSDGTVSVTSAPGQGTTLDLYFPKVKQ
jgi:signal transduction histidine kinase